MMMMMMMAGLHGETLVGRLPKSPTALLLQRPMRILLHHPGMNRSENLPMSPIPRFGDASVVTPLSTLGTTLAGVAECAVAVISTTAPSRR